MYDKLTWCVGIWSGHEQLGCSGFVVMREVHHIAHTLGFGVYGTRTETMEACRRYAQQYKTYAVDDQQKLYADYREKELT